MTLRVGLGFDVHRLVPGRPCILGGLALPHPAGPDGHSDGDAVLHALADAILGAAGLDDLGTLFPPDDPRFKDADSRTLLRESVARAAAAGWRIVNVDLAIVADAPRIGPHRAALRASIAQALGVPAELVNLKGKSTEGLGALAGGKGIAVQAVCLLERD